MRSNPAAYGDSLLRIRKVISDMNEEWFIPKSTERLYHQVGKASNRALLYLKRTAFVICLKMCSNPAAYGDSLTMDLKSDIRYE